MDSVQGIGRVIHDLALPAEIQAAREDGQLAAHRINLVDYRASPSEHDRAEGLMSLVPTSGKIALDVGARDGFFSLRLAERFRKVIALDLNKPTISHPRVVCRQGDAANIDLPDDSVDFILCAEVIEHLPKTILPKVCRELERVCNDKMLIGVPYRQDIRVGRTTCYSCFGKNPPWGHVNSFNERNLANLFRHYIVESSNFVGENADQTNPISTLLMDLAGNPFGTYDQEEPCIHCGRPLLPPPARSLGQKVLTKLAVLAREATGVWAQPRANWIHMLLSKRRTPGFA